MNSYNGFSGAQRTLAQRWLTQEWALGRLKRPAECCACGQTHGPIDAHAEDYSQPFAAGKTDQYHLCYACHIILHCRFRNPERFREYCERIKAGERFNAAGRSWLLIQQFLATGEWSAGTTKGPARDIDVLGAIPQQMGARSQAQRHATIQTVAGARGNANMR